MVIFCCRQSPKYQLVTRMAGDLVRTLVSFTVYDFADLRRANSHTATAHVPQRGDNHHTTGRRGTNLSGINNNSTLNRYRASDNSLSMLFPPGRPPLCCRVTVNFRNATWQEWESHPNLGGRGKTLLPPNRENMLERATPGTHTN